MGVVVASTLVGAPAAVAAPAPSSRLDRDAALEISRDARESGKDRRLAPLQGRDDGGYDYHDPKDRFSATIHPDGQVSFSPARRIGRQICLVGPGCGRFVGVVEFLLNPGEWESRPTANQAGAAVMGGVNLNVPLPQNYSMSGRPGDGLPTPIAFGVGGSFGPPVLSDRIRAEFLKETFELRLRLAIKAERARLASALSVLEDRLMGVWSDPSTSIEARRERLFELWDECLDELAPASDELPEDDLVAPLDDARRRAAGEGRRRILQFIRARAPAGSAAAYTPEELRRFNARRVSVEPFDPYGGAP
ncbi:MAG: hypothetical protein R3B09_21340 [Nannocystaceae bacterium]